jgi:hypothetical protein
MCVLVYKIYKMLVLPQVLGCINLIINGETICGSQIIILIVQKVTT